MLNHRPPSNSPSILAVRSPRAAATWPSPARDNHLACPNAVSLDWQPGQLMLYYCQQMSERVVRCRLSCQSRLQGEI